MLHSKTLRTGFYGALASAALFTTTAHAAGITIDYDIFEINADDAAGIQYTVDSFRDALGPLNAPAPVNGDPNGRRQINWDAAPDVVSDPNAFPGDFFNFNAAPRARGIEFKPVGDTTGFQLSSTEASGEPVEFGFSGGFTFFSPERLFTPIGGTLFDVQFFDPTDQYSQALSRGLGVVFTDVEEAGTTMSFYDVNDELIMSREVLAGKNASLSFLGVVFDDPKIARVRIDAGLFGRADSVVMDDFIYGEPIPASDVAPVPLPAPALLLIGGLAGLGALRRRKG